MANKKIFTDESLSTLISEIKTYTDSTVSDKAESGHKHSIEDVENLQDELDEKVPVTRTINGKLLDSNITLSASDVDAYSKTEIDNMEFVAVDDIHAICGASIQMAREVSF